MRPHGIVIYVNSLSDGVEFYQALFGHPPKTLEQKRGFAEFDLKGFNFIVHEIPISTLEKPVPSRPAPILELEADPDEFHRRLAASKYDTPAAPSDRNYGLRQLNVRDPDGNRISIVKPL
jgi:catechol 2,3-dioxygenase-like lactoylglutathione lyase family enzyme